MSNRHLSRARKGFACAVRARAEARAEGFSAKRQAKAERLERVNRRRYLEALRLDGADSLAWEA